MTTPLPTWTIYRYLPLEQREQIHLTWCQEHDRDPDSESDVDEFFDLLDAVPEPDPNTPRPPYTGRPRGRPRKVQP